MICGWQARLLMILEWTVSLCLLSQPLGSTVNICVFIRCHFCLSFWLCFRALKIAWNFSKFQDLTWDTPSWGKTPGGWWSDGPGGPGYQFQSPDCGPADQQAADWSPADWSTADLLMKTDEDWSTDDGILKNDGIRHHWSRLVAIAFTARWHLASRGRWICVG